MKNFYNGQRVLVRSCDANNGGTVEFDPPQPGRVVRLRHYDDGAWVELDAIASASAHPFPVEDARARHVLTFPEFCEPEPKKDGAS